MIMIEEDCVSTFILSSLMISALDDDGRYYLSNYIEIFIECWTFGKKMKHNMMMIITIMVMIIILITW